MGAGERFASSGWLAETVTRERGFGNMDRVTEVLRGTFKGVNTNI